MVKLRALSSLLILTLFLASLDNNVQATAPEMAPSAALQGAGATADWWRTIQENIRQSEYHITWQARTDLHNLPAAYQAPNRAHNLRTYFAPAGVRLIPRLFEDHIPPWQWQLDLAGWGYTGSVQPVPNATLHVEANRIQYRRGLLTEWYLNETRGLQQGFTLNAPPGGENTPAERGHIVLKLAFHGNLTTALSAGGETIEVTSPGKVGVLDYGRLAAHDANGRPLSARLSLSPQKGGQGEGSIYITLDDAGALYPITVNLLAAAPAWTAEGDQANARFGFSVGTAGDVNGDGFSDVIVGASEYDKGQEDEGRAYVFHGGVTGLAAAPAWTAEGDQVAALFGFSVATAGDVNGDGFSDVIVGAYRYDNGQSSEGQAYVFHGGATGLAAAPAWTAEGDQDSAFFGFSVGTAGDVNGDGFSDVIVGASGYGKNQTGEGRASVFHGGATGLTAAPAWTARSDRAGFFGWSVGTAGDVNGDGFSDVIVGAPRYDNGQMDEGQAAVYYGAATGLATAPAWTAESDQADALFGTSVGTAGDVNGDGFSDIIVGAYGYDRGQEDEGRAFVFHGAATGLATMPTWTAEGNQVDANFGRSVATAGDVNGDGFSDVIISASGYDKGQEDEGQAYVYHGRATGLATTPTWTAEGDQDSAFFGWSVGTAGDVNGDGFSDVIAGAYGYDKGQEDEGQAYVYHGGAVGLATTPAWTAEGDQVDAFFGVSVGTAGDVNGDGFSDVIVGAYTYDNGQEDEGRAYVFHGGPTGLADTPAWTAEGNQVDAIFGVSVGTAGDVNGDGFSDVIVGAYRYDNGQEDEGRVYVFHGGPTGLADTPAWTAESDQDDAFFGVSVGTAGDVNGDGFSDVIAGAHRYDNEQTNEGRVYVYHGGAMGLAAAPAWTAESDQDSAFFGESVGTAGDVNGDGFSDVIAGARRYDKGQEDEGQAAVYHGGATGLADAPAWTAESNQTGAYFGRAVGTAGDVNGDGFSDVIVGAYGYDNGQTSEGRATVFHGGAMGLADAPAWTAESNQDLTFFGRAAGTAGDVNGDGFSDVIVSAYTYDKGQEDEGRAFLYYGNGGDGLPLLPRQRRSDGAAPIAHLGLSDSGTAFQLSLIGRMPLGREQVRLEWQVAPLGTAFTAPGVISGVGDWTDTLTSGVEIRQTVTGLAPAMAYHWRARLHYRPGNALGQPAGRWVHLPGNGWHETDLRTHERTPIYLPIVVR